MKRQVLKIADREQFTVLYDSEAMPDQAYALYYLTHRPNEAGVYTKRKYLVTKENSLRACLAWISDILYNKRVLGQALSRELRSMYG